MKKIKARYVFGLTATPIRKDGHHPIIFMQCGPIRFRVDAKQFMQQSAMKHIVKLRYTQFHLPLGQEQSHINDMYNALITDETRNNLIFNDILEALEVGRVPLLLTERVQPLDCLVNKLNKFVKNIIVLQGGMGKKQRQKIMEQLQNMPEGEERVIIAIGRYIGEGFDDVRLDILFLTMPISWQGTLQQYVGRLHRHHNQKTDVLVYDYVDCNVRMLAKMYEKRAKKYRAIGYAIEE